MKLSIIFSQWRLFLGAVFFSVIFLWNCDEQPLEAGLDLLPESDLLDVIVDTLPVELFTVSDEAIVTQSIGVSPLGSVNDPEIGMVEMDFITDFIYSKEVSFLEDDDSVSVIDLKLEFSYSITYGDPTEVDFNIYELLEPLPNYTKSDYQMFSHMYDPEPLNTSSLIFVPDTNLALVDLSDEFANRLVEGNQIDTLMYYSENQQRFKAYFKGLYFAVTPRTEDGGGMMLVDHYNSKMILRTLEWNYHEDPDSAGWDTLTNIFYLGNPESDIDTGGVHLNLYRTTPSAQVAGVLDNLDTLHNRAYINALTGPRVLVRLPTLPELRAEYEGEISVNFAHLIIPYDEEIYRRDTALYTAPNQLGLYDSEQNAPILDDELAENHLGGKIDEEDGYFKFNIGNHVHNYLRSEASLNSNAFYLFAATGSPVSPFKYTPARIVLNGSTAETNKPYVRIVYSIIPR